jgi:hypothetical protein
MKNPATLLRRVPGAKANSSELPWSVPPVAGPGENQGGRQAVENKTIKRPPRSRVVSGWARTRTALLGESAGFALPDVYAQSLNPGHLSAAERLDEIAEILATGLMRLHGRKSSPLFPPIGESSLDCPAHQSGHANALNDGGME